MSTVYLLIGLPGSGKSTWSRQLTKNNQDVIIISRDSFRTMIKDEYTFNLRFEPFIKQATNKSIECAIENGFDVIVDETHIRKDRRLEIIKTIRDYESSYGLITDIYGRTKIVYLWFTESTNNLENRMKEPRNHDIDQWKQVIEGMIKVFEEPTEDEGCDELIKINPFKGDVYSN